MLSEQSDPREGSVPAAPKERVQVGPVPDWVAPCGFRLDFRAKQPGHVTCLLSSQQLHAEKRQRHFHTALRLETIQGVERHSHWRVEVLPQTQRITLHWIKIHRNGAEIDHTTVDKLQPAQREIDGLASPGRVTLGLLLEDVRPGDILEWSYTVEETPLLLPEHCACLFAVPTDAPLGKFHFSARFKEGRPMRWKSSAAELQPAETKENGAVTWIWEQEGPPVARMEDDAPLWHIDNPWIQVSDCADWETVSAAFAEAWKEDGAEADAGVEDVAKEINAQPGGVLQQIERAFHLVQEEYRHLDVEDDLAAQKPAPPETVSRRRFGNSLDLSLFLARLLNRLGAAARPVLVNTTFRKSLSGFLPMPGLFNHVVVEFQARGETRWIDATAKGQGGGPLNRVIPGYGTGLPVARAASGLVEAPLAAISASAYEIRETILLDTAGAVSLLAVVVTARGSHAEELRREFDTRGAESIARRRLQLCMDRFTDATRTGPMEYRDNRAANEFFLAETFAVKDFLTPDAKAGWYRLEVADDFAAGVLQQPDPGARRTPFALPYPCNMTHVFEVHCVALPPAIVQERVIENSWLQYTRQRKTLAGSWTITSRLVTLADAVPPERMDEHRDSLRQIRAQGTWSVMAPAGQERPHQRSDFGRLPVSWETSGADAPVLRTALPEQPARNPSPPVPARLATEHPKAATATGASVAASGTVRFKRRKRHRRHHREYRREFVWQAILAGALVIVLLLLVFALVQNTDRWLPRLPQTELPQRDAPQ